MGLKYDCPSLRSKPAGLLAGGFDQGLVAAMHAIEVADRQRSAARRCWNIIAAVDDAHGAGIAALNGLRSSTLLAGCALNRSSPGFMPPSLPRVVRAPSAPPHPPTRLSRPPS